MAASAQIAKVNWRHEQIVDWMLANPKARQSECADEFGVTEAWLSTIINSDAFIEYRARRYALHQKMLSESTIERVEGLAQLGVEVLSARIEAERESIPLGIVKESADMALKACGFGAKTAGGAAVEVNINVADADSLARARERMRLVASRPDEPVTTVTAAQASPPPQLEHNSPDEETQLQAIAPTALE